MLMTRISKRKIVLLLFDKTSGTQNHAPSLFQECNYSLQASTENKTDMRKQASLGQDEVELGDLSFLMLQEKLRPWVPSSRVQMGHMRVACLHHIFSLSALPLSPQVHSICNNPFFKLYQHTTLTDSYQEQQQKFVHHTWKSGHIHLPQQNCKVNRGVNALLLSVA